MPHKKCEDPVKIHLKSAESLRRLMSSTINRLRRKEISQAEARTTGYLVDITLKILDEIRKEKVFAEQDEE